MKVQSITVGGTAIVDHTPLNIMIGGGPDNPNLTVTSSLGPADAIGAGVTVTATMDFTIPTSVTGAVAGSPAVVITLVNGP